MFKLRMAVLITALAYAGPATAQPVRKYDDKGAPPFKVLNEGENPPLDAYDNFVIGPNYVPAPERKKVEGVPEGRVEQFEIDSKETKLFNPGIARDAFGEVDPSNPKTLIVETHPIDYKRKIGVYPVRRQAAAWTRYIPRRRQNDLLPTSGSSLRSSPVSSAATGSRTCTSWTVWRSASTTSASRCP